MLHLGELLLPRKKLITTISIWSLDFGGMHMEKKWKKCWDIVPEIYTMIKECANKDDARKKMMEYLDDLERKFRFGDLKMEPWDAVLFRDALNCLKNIFSPRNEEISKQSPIEHLWNAAVNGDANVSQGFIEEFYHLFKGIKGEADVYPPNFLKNMEYPDFESMSGRNAGIARSNFLDEMGDRIEKYLRRYTCGLDPSVQDIRELQRKKILEVLGSSEDDWYDWKWQFKHVFKHAKHIELIKKVIKLTEDEEKGIRLAVENHVPFGITPHYLHLMDPEPNGRDFAVRRQVIPPVSYVKNMIEHREDRNIVFDFMREHDTSPTDLVTRRYVQVAILKPYDSCPQICVYCQRNWEITSPLMLSALAPRETLDKTLDWFANHPHIIDILITGGDPFVMDDKLIEYILQRISEMEHVKNIRIGTRIPITVPMRITKKLCEILGSYYEPGKRYICIVTHFSHPYEITKDTMKAIERIRKEGIYTYNQEVFTFANSRRFETSALRLHMKLIGVDPYYNFNMKGKSEMEEYAVPIARILQERKEEARLLPGIYRTDEPVFNVPFLGKNHLRAWQDHEIISITPEGRRVYLFHPWEKNLNKVKPYVYVDVPILEYLERLKERGESVEDYKSIWYYY